MSGDLRRVVEEEDRRLLMPASGGCFRFVVDVERLSTKREEERQTREAGFKLEAKGREFRFTKGSNMTSAVFQYLQQAKGYKLIHLK